MNKGPKEPVKNIIKNIRARKEAERKRNFTFSINAELMLRFSVKCKANDVSMAAVIQEMMREYVES